MRMATRRITSPFLVHLAAGAVAGCMFAIVVLLWAHLLPIGGFLESIVLLPTTAFSLIPALLRHPLEGNAHRILIISGILWAILGGLISRLIRRTRPRRAPRPIGITIIFAGLIVIGSLVIYVCAWLLMGGLAAAKLIDMSPGLAAVSDTASVELPASSRLIGSYSYIFLQSRNTYAKVEMNQSEVDKFIQSLSKDAVMSQSDRQQVTNDAFGDPRPDWWDPDSAGDFLSLAIHRHDPDYYDETVRILVTYPPGKAIVYIIWFA